MTILCSWPALVVGGGGIAVGHDGKAMQQDGGPWTMSAYQRGGQVRSVVATPGCDGKAMPQGDGRQCHSVFIRAPAKFAAGWQHLQGSGVRSMTSAAILISPQIDHNLRVLGQRWWRAAVVFRWGRPRLNHCPQPGPRSVYLKRSWH